MILIRMDLREEGNAVTYRWKADSLEFERFTHYAEIQTLLDRSAGYPVYVEKTSKTTGLVNFDQGVRPFRSTPERWRMVGKPDGGRISR
jgi:hypothetical protein